MNRGFTLGFLLPESELLAALARPVSPLFPILLPLESWNAASGNWIYRTLAQAPFSLNSEIVVQ
jgi:hypothetical protein